MLVTVHWHLHYGRIVRPYFLLDYCPFLGLLFSLIVMSFSTTVLSSFWYNLPAGCICVLSLQYLLDLHSTSTLVLFCLTIVRVVSSRKTILNFWLMPVQSFRTIPWPARDLSDSTSIVASSKSYNLANLATSSTFWSVILSLYHFYPSTVRSFTHIFSSKYLVLRIHHID